MLVCYIFVRLYMGQCVCVPQRVRTERETAEMEKLPQEPTRHARVQIGHHMVIESRGGVARVFQACAFAYSAERDAPSAGYTAREWCAPEPPPHWSARCVAAHARWGGGRELARGELQELLALLLLLREQAEAVALALAQQLPAQLRGDARAAAAHAQALCRRPEWLAASGEWEDEVAGACVFTHASCPLVPCRLLLRGAECSTFARAYAELSGAPPAPWVAAALLHAWPFVAARKRVRHAASPGGTRPFGWAASVLAVPHGAQADGDD